MYKTGIFLCGATSQPASACTMRQRLTMGEAICSLSEETINVKVELTETFGKGGKEIALGGYSEADYAADRADCKL
ncbi:unnamed protein product [Peronospora belbahrii]|uniref:Uncharacterized protein n=1 Tax=Peronospora belbahrii TaxID=622444 RepID=A0ABN8D1U6_9STRA|nr:unnamed protein product [Peronospora belbahrii]